jgi:hypothetical protein
LTKSDDDDRMQKKSENVSHPQDGIKLEEAQEFRALAEFAYQRFTSGGIELIAIQSAPGFVVPCGYSWGLPEPFDSPTRDAG